MRFKYRVGVLSLAGAIGLAGTMSAVASDAAGAAAPGVTAKTITLGYITSITGVSSSNFADGVKGAQARIDQQNAAGGVNGRKLKLEVADDQSSPAQDATAAQDLVQAKGVFGVIPYSAFTFGSAKYLNQQGVPVTGFGFDGPEWALPTNSNMFTFLAPVNNSVGGTYYNYDYYGKFLKQIGVKKVGGLAYGISASSKASISAMFASAAKHGISNCYQNMSVPFGGVDFTAASLAIKSSGCDGIVGSFVDSSDVALSTAIKQAGINTKQLYYTGYDQLTLSSPAALAAFEGDYFSNYILLDPAIPAVATMFKAFSKYIPGYVSGTLPDFGLLGSYIATDLMIKGLQVAGKNPTQAGFIQKLRKVKNYNAGGLLPTPVSFTGFGTSGMIPKTGCEYFVQLKNGKFVNVLGGTKALCGPRLSYQP